MVVIKDFEIPSCCWTCRFLTLTNGQEICFKRNDDCPLVEVEAIPKDQYEARLKADMVAMLTELKKEIEEIEIDVPFGFEPVSKTSAFYEGVSASSRLIQQKIKALEKI